MGGVPPPEHPTVQDLEPILPAEAGLRAHCRRVASLAIEIATRLRLSPADLLTVERSAWLHHYPHELFEPPAFDRLMADLASARRREAAGEQQQCLPADVETVLRALQAPMGEKARDQAGLMAQIIEVANAFDEQLEHLPYEYRTMDQIMDELRWMAHDGIYDPAVVAALASLPHIRKDALIEVIYQFPVFPTVMLRALAVTPESKALMAGVLEPLFTSGGLPDLWSHSLETAELSERIATLGSGLDIGEAFLAGLVHDIGRLALHKLSGEGGASYLRFLERGCEPVFAEMVLCRFDHAATGAEVLRAWNFPETVIEGVESHHQPERSESKLASLLYLAEFWSASQEDLPSQVRLHRALELTGISIEQLCSLSSAAGLTEPRP